MKRRLKSTGFFLVLSLFFHSLLFISASKQEPPSIELTVKKGISPVAVEPYSIPKVVGKSGTLKVESQGVSDGSDLGIIKPEYPSLSQIRGEEGRVLIELTLNEKNELIGLEVLESSNFSSLDRAAVKAVKESLSPATSSEKIWKKKITFAFGLTQ